MKQILLFVFLLVNISISFSQVGIGTTMPQSSLDIRGANHLGGVSESDGILVPRVNALSTAGLTDGQLVYLIADVSTFSKGFHYWDSTANKWTPINSNVEPWNEAGTTNAATSNSDNLYTMGQVGIGTDNPLGALHITTQNSRDVLLFRFIDSPGDDLDIDLLRARGTASAPTLLQDNTRLGGIRGQSFTGSSTLFNPSAEIWFQTEGASSPTSSAAEINFATTPVGALSTIERMTIKSDGKVGIGTNSPGELLHISGGTLRITNGTQAAGKVLTSDANGTATWQVPGANAANWSLQGNTITATDFLGTTNAQPLNFKVNNISVGSIQTNNSLHFGRDASSGGIRATALGNAAIASSDESIALGSSATASGAQSTATGYQSNAQGNQSTAYGRGARSEGSNTVALGSNARASTVGGTAVGPSASTTADYTVAVGNGSTASGNNAVALGNAAVASNGQTVALGVQANASGQNATALGNNTAASGAQGVAVGNIAIASNTNSIAIGNGTNASGLNAVALGNGALSTKLNSIAIGQNAEANGANAIALGNAVVAPNDDTVILGNNSKVGIGTNAPAATLDVVGRATNLSALDGVIPPRLTGDQLKAKTYTTAQNGAILYVTAATTVPAGQTINVTAEGLYVFSSSQNRWNPLGGSGFNVGERKSVYRTVNLANNEYLNNSGLIELEGLIRVTVQRRDATVYRPQFINISGGNLKVTVTGTTEGATNQVDHDTNLTLGAGDFVSPDPDGITYWSATLSETVTGQIALPNGSFYEVKWLAFPTTGDERRIYMSAERLF
ncbi:hypothetical protein [Leeuwenhoekiella sp. MAR_2009_132]|uniref:hypothetical protein n=1 Tax=Leeuwenhoekiella sp. MAR_2009_132 TaxID=1392489 RepID=UPI00048D8796|nr:hypothetical protein [Leeuwenhoekiella sp. MAR_2009_132]